MPWLVPLATAAYSVYSSAHAASQAKKAERGLENMQPPKYKPNQSILDYYQTALSRYNTNPTDSAEYKAQKQNINQNITQGIAAGTDRRLGGALVPALIQGGNNALLKAAVSGEQRKAQDFARLGQATQARAAEEGKEFQYNKIAPFEKNYNLLAMKAAGNRADQRTATQNTYNNLGAASSLLDGDGKGFDWSSLFRTNSRGGIYNANKYASKTGYSLI